MRLVTSGQAENLIGTLAQNDTLLTDSRVEVIREVLGRRLRLPDVVNFATMIQPERTTTVKGVDRIVPPQAVFLVVSPNPHPRHQGEMIQSYAVTSLEHWRQKEDAAWRFVRAGDPATLIFESLCHQHMANRRHWAELN